MVDEELLDVAHHLEGELRREDAGALALILLQDVRLHGPPHRAQGPGDHRLQRRGIGISTLFGAISVHLLFDGGVEEHGQYRRSRAVDGHRHRGGRVAEVEAGVEDLHVVQRGY